MTDIVSAAAVAFGVVFLAELGDKTQLLALGFGARYSLRQVAMGLFVGYGLANVAAVVVGGMLGATFPERPVEIVGGLIFLIFAATTLFLGDDDDADAAENADDATVERTSQTTGRAAWLRSSAVVAIGFAILVAEMGDKTQVANATLATRSSPAGVWIGGTLGATASGMVGAFAGTLLGERISADRLRLASGLLFAAFGVLMIVGVF